MYNVKSTWLQQEERYHTYYSNEEGSMSKTDKWKERNKYSRRYWTRQNCYKIYGVVVAYCTTVVSES